jgi:lipopolysaccharide export LptBFGC system permease protein LptF
MNKPGVRLRSLASRLFDPATMEYVIAPVLADLQLECIGAESEGRWRRSWICLRAYLSFWSAVGVHLWSNLVDAPSDRDAVDRRTLARMLVSGGAALSAVIGALVLVVPLTMVGSMARLRIAFSGNIFYAFALLVPQAMPIAIPAALVFGALWGVRQRPAPRSIRRTILLMGVCGSLLSATLLEWAIPRANQAFRVVVFQNGDHRTLPPAKGSNELTWRELGDRITRLQALGPSAELRQMRLAYQGRIAFAATPVIFSVLAIGILRRRRTRWSTLGGLFALAAFVSYYVLFGFSQLVGNGTLSPTTVAWTPNAVALLLASALSGLRRRSVRPVWCRGTSWSFFQ